MSEGTPVDYSKEAEKPIPQVGNLVDSALKLFHSKHTFAEQGQYLRGYTSLDAADDAVLNSGFTPLEVFATLTQHTDLDAGNSIVEVDDGETWEELELRVNRTILRYELLKAHPEINKEDRLRNRWASNSERKWNEEHPFNPSDL